MDDFADYSDSSATFGDRLALARETQKLTQAQLARRLGVRRDTIEAWEADRSEPRANRLQMLSGLLNVSLVWLMTGKGEGAPVMSGLEPDTSTEMGTIISELRAMRLEHTRAIDRISRIEQRLRRLSGAA